MVSWTKVSIVRQKKPNQTKTKDGSQEKKSNDTHHRKLNNIAHETTQTPVYIYISNSRVKWEATNPQRKGLMKSEQEREKRWQMTSEPSERMGETAFVSGTPPSLLIFD